tara:strand:+ start:654 stop:1226 length:573 start_codon:yes stop_codon:yes gene_type:complete
MNKSLVIKILLILFTIILIIFIYSKLNKKEQIVINDDTNSEDTNSNANTIKDVKYVSKDASGNEYVLLASEGQIDISDNKKIFLTDVRAIIDLNDNTKIEIRSDFGKYDIDNFDTIFSKNVIIGYINNRITANYLDFSLERNSLIISKNVIYTNLENMLKADVVEIDIKTKDTKIYMQEEGKKVNIKSIN